MVIFSQYNRIIFFLILEKKNQILYYLINVYICYLLL